jgi:hypothetical protein
MKNQGKKSNNIISSGPQTIKKTEDYQKQTETIKNEINIKIKYLKTG